MFKQMNRGKARVWSEIGYGILVHLHQNLRAVRQPLGIRVSKSLSKRLE